MAALILRSQRNCDSCKSFVMRFRYFFFCNVSTVLIHERIPLTASFECLPHLSSLYHVALRQSYQHFVDTVQGYLITQVLHTSWDELQKALKSTDSLGALIQAHRDYLENATKRCLLNDRSAKVMDIIKSIFSQILKFQLLLRTHTPGTANFSDQVSQAQLLCSVFWSRFGSDF